MLGAADIFGASRLGRYSRPAIRRVFRTIGHDVGFFYFGELTIPRR